MSNTATLKDIALVSEAFHRATLPALFHTLYLPFFDDGNEDKWFQLLTELLRYPQKARLVKEIHLTQSTLKSPSRDVLNAFQKSFRTWAQTINLPKSLRRSVLEALMKKDFPTEKALLLCLCSQVKRITTPFTYNSSGKYNGHSVQSLKAPRSGLARTIQILGRALVPPVLEDRTATSARFTGLMTLPEAGCLQKFLNLQELRLSEVARHGSFAGLDEVVLQTLEGVSEDLHYFSLDTHSVTPELLKQILNRMPKLTTLSIESQWSEEYKHHRRELGHIFAKNASNLRRLRVSTPRKNPQAAQCTLLVGNICKLQCLQCLEISTTTLFGESDHTGTRKVLPLYQNLPRSLRCLVIHWKPQPFYLSSKTEVGTVAYAGGIKLEDHLTEDLLKMMDARLFPDLHLIGCNIGDIELFKSPGESTGWMVGRPTPSERSIYDITWDTCTHHWPAHHWLVNVPRKVELAERDRSKARLGFRINN